MKINSINNGKPIIHFILLKLKSKNTIFVEIQEYFVKSMFTKYCRKIKIEN